MPAYTARVHRKAPCMCTSCVRHHSSPSASQIGAYGPVMPALLTSTLTGPSRSASLTARCTSAALVTSPATAMARPPLALIASAAWSISFFERAMSATLAPAVASASAMARPMPRPGAGDQRDFTFETHTPAPTPAACRDARRAPSANAASLAHTMLGYWRWMPAPWAKPQSLLAITFSRPTSSA